MANNTQTILRVKRRRTEDPLQFIRLEGLGHKQRKDDSVQGLTDNIKHMTTPSTTKTTTGEIPLVSSSASNKHNNSSNNSGSISGARKRKCAVWRRLSADDTENTTSAAATSTTKNSNKHSELAYRIFNALLEDSESDSNKHDDGHHDPGVSNKRRKLTLLDNDNASTLPSSLPGFINIVQHATTKAPVPIKILDPLTRLVDDSLQMVHTGAKPIADHYQFVMSDSRLYTNSRKWITWCHSQGGNILHACALWNDIEIASQVLQHITPASILTEAVDSDGRTPYEVAQLSGHDSVCQVLEAFGGDTSNYVYDIFALDDNQDDVDDDDEMEVIKHNQSRSNNVSTTDTTVDNTAAVAATVELRGGVGYWTPEGELVLEAPEKKTVSLTHVFDEDGEIDSNCEEYGGNDYPEDDYWGDGDDNNSIDDEDEDYITNITFRNYPIEF